MDTFSQIVDIILHLDKYLVQIIHDYGALTYLLLFIIVFCETGLVVTPFLPGDSLIFVVGALSASGGFNVWIAMGVLMAAAVLGDTANYHIGKAIGHKLFQKENSRIFKKKYLDQTHAFYEKYGGKTIILARFIPVIRTFAPFVAGMGSMTYRKFILYNVLGGALWVALFINAGFFFGNIPIVKDNFSFVIIAIILISCVPGVVTFLKERNAAKKEKAK